MHRPIFISLIPNFSEGDVKMSLQMFFRPSQYRNMAWTSEFRAKLTSVLGTPYVSLYESGRAAEYFLLKALGIEAGDEVIIQAFTCVAVPNSILWNGAKPVYADIDAHYNLDPQSLEERITPKTKAVIVQHTFGHPADIEKIAAICKKHNIFFIEDCAHALGGTYKGKNIGSFGDAAFFSFGRDKVISGISGGAIATRNEALAKKLEEISDRLPTRSALWIAKKLLYAPLTALVINTYTFFGIGKVLHLFLKSVRLLPKVLTKDEKLGIKPRVFYAGMPAPLARLASLQLDRLEGFIAHRRSLAKQYAEALGTGYAPESSYIRYTIEVQDPDHIRREAAQHNIFLGDWYDTVVAPNSVSIKNTGYVSGSCPRAEAATKVVINLPTTPNTSARDAQRVITLLKNLSHAN